MRSRPYTRPSRLITVSALALAATLAAPARAQEAKGRSAIKLPAPHTSGQLAVEGALQQRRSLRSFGPAPLSLAEVGQLLWAAQGITDGRGRRTAPSAGALYPLELYLVAGNVTGLPAGVYRYLPASHELLPVVAGDRRQQAAAACRQRWVAEAPAAVALTAVFPRTAKKYGERATRYVPFEAGAAAENLALQAVALGLGTTVVGAFDDAELAAALGAAADEQPLALVPVGRK